jgi:hypothetical protein
VFRNRSLSPIPVYGGSAQWEHRPPGGRPSLRASRSGHQEGAPSVPCHPGRSRSRTQVGVHATPHLLLAFGAWGVVDGVRYLAYGPSATHEVSGGWAVELGYDHADRIRNVASGPTLRLGISLRN